MSRSDRGFYIAIAAIAIIIVGGYAGLAAYTGFGTPFSVVTSQSMQHDQTHSQLGVIDTGDMVIVRDSSKADIHSYVQGTVDGYSSFGDYGSVIIYDRGNDQNPVIHRAILWLDYDSSTGTWSAPQLENYKGEWKSSNGTDWSNITGTLEFKNITASKKSVSVNMESLPGKSGYLTMGDNSVTNNYFDQSVGIVNHLVGTDDIRSVAIFEIPWVGCIKLAINGSSNLRYVENSIPSLVMAFVSIFMLLLLLDVFTVYRNQKKTTDELDRFESCSR